jgi:hypothetical protein
MERII